MNALLVLGWIGNACFFGRVCLQWWHAERQRVSDAPAAFWYLSLAGSIALGFYAVDQHAFVLLIGYVLGGAIYVRNLWMQQGRAHSLSPRTLGVAAVVLTVTLVSGGLLEFAHRTDPSLVWIAIAILGQSLWSARFVVQWWASERALKSHFPRKFWWLSLTGNSLLLAYALHLRDPVFVAGFLLGPVVQIRNLMLSVAQETPAANRLR